MIKKFQLIVLLTLWLSSGLFAQEVILSDEFDAGDGKWTSGWIDGSTTDVTVSIDTNGVLSGKNSYLIDVVEGGPDTWRIQRNADCPLLAGNLYTVSFLAVADRDVTFNVLFEIQGDPYTKRLIEWPEVTTTPQAFTYTMSSTENVPDNELKLHFGGPDNDNVKIWVDSIVVTQEPDPGLVDQWGLADHKAWPILNDETTARGDASIAGESPHGWTSLRGSFGQDVSISTENAVIVSGQMEFVGGSAGDNYTPIRYALTHQADEGELLYVNTDSAQWSVNGGHSGYSFMPRTGTGTMANGAGGVGTVWTIINGNWVSTWSNNGWPVTAVNQAPRNAEIVAGTYDFAISVHAIDDTTNEIRWYMVEENDKYWFGGTARDTAMTTMFNGVVFGLETGEATGFNVSGVRFDLGAPIEIPEAPWEKYYIDQWGLVQEYKTLWPILNDSLTLVGDGSMGGDVVSGWKGLQGGFGQDVSITTEKAVIVRGKIKFTGADAGAAYTPIRYAFTYQDSSELMYQFTDSAQWSGTGHHYGYGFHPRTGTGTMSNGAGGVGTVWTINDGNWASTWSNNGGPIAAVNQAPRNAEIKAGTYDFAISVHAIDNTTNEIRWIMFHEDEASYWFGGIVQDTATTKKFNSVIFGVNEVEFTQFDALAMEVDLGTPIDIPPAPWEDFYVDTWGIYGGNNGGWNLAPGAYVGNVDFNGTAAPTGWAVVRGDLQTVMPEPDEDIFVIKGNIILEGGGFESSASLRFGLFEGTNAGTLDSTETGYNWNGTDDGNTGYLILAQEGSNNIETWGTGSGNWGEISDDVWHNFAGGTALGDMAPLQTTGGAGTYEFAIMVRPFGDGTTKILWTLQKGDGSYYMEGGAIDDSPITSFNSIVVGIGDGATATSMFLTDVQATMVDEEIPNDIESFESLIPTHFALKQNYPNPFNPSTTIEYALPQNTDVSLKVYDIRGRLVKELVNGPQNAGYYKITYDASDLSSGIYFFEIRAGEFVNVKKMMLLK